MDKKDLADKAIRAKNWLEDTTIDVIVEAKQRHDSDLYNEGYDDGMAFQKKLDARSAVNAFLELKVKDQDIYRLLSDHFGIDSVVDVTELLKKAKISRQIIALRKHCEKIGMSNNDFYEYAHSHNLEELLSEDEKLLYVQPDKLKAIIDRN